MSEADQLNAAMLSNIDPSRQTGASAADIEKVRGLRQLAAERAARGYAAGGKVERYAKGGSVGAKCRDGLATRGKTRGRFI
jgi:hypothetical protein